MVWVRIWGSILSWLRRMGGGCATCRERVPHTAVETDRMRCFRLKQILSWLGRMAGCGTPKLLRRSRNYEMEEITLMIFPFSLKDLPKRN